MLRLMLNGHPRFECPGETDFLFDHLIEGKQGEWRYDLEALEADRIFQESRARLPNTDDFGPALASMINDLRDGSDSSLILMLHRGLARLLDTMPDVKILHMVRDPRDVARSAIGMNWAGNVYFGAKTWLVTEREWERVGLGLSEHQVREFQYEALLRAPEETLGNICSFLNDTFVPGMLNFSENSTYSKVDASLAEQWRRKQTPRELGLIEPLFGELLTKRGYAPSGHPPINPSALERLQLRIDHSSSIWRRRIAKYGLRDPIIVLGCQKLGLPRKWCRPAQRRIDRITTQYLK